MKLNVYRDNSLEKGLDLYSEISPDSEGITYFYLGRGDDCFIDLDDPRIGRENAVITHRGNVWTLKNISDHENVFLNNLPIREQGLRNGDKIRIGRYLLEVGLPEVTIQSQNLTASETIVSPNPMEQTENQPENPEELTEAIDLDGELDRKETEEQDDLDIDGDLSLEGSDIEVDDVEEDNSEFEQFASDESSDSDEESSGEETFESGFDEDNGMDGESDEFAMSEYDDDMDDEDGGTQVIQSFSKAELEIFGEFAPFDKFIIPEGVTIIGRDQSKAQIVLNDPEVSKEHAKIIKDKANIRIEDLSSGNGTYLNGARILKTELASGDEVIIGETTFTLHITSSLLEEEKNRLIPVEENQEIEVEEIVEVEAPTEELNLELGDVGEEEKSIFKNPKKRKMLIYGAVIVAGALLFLDDGKKSNKNLGKSPKKVNAKKVKADAPKKKVAAPTKRKKFRPEVEEELKANYEILKSLIRERDPKKLDQAMSYVNRFEKLGAMDYKQVRQIKQSLLNYKREVEEAEQAKMRKIEAKKTAAKVKIKLGQLEEFVNKYENGQKAAYLNANDLINQIKELDPGNFKVLGLERRLKYQSKQFELEERERLAKLKVKQKLEQKLSKATQAYLRKNWYQAIREYTKFLEDKEVLKNERLIKDTFSSAIKRMELAKKNLEASIGPLLGKAQSLKEGQNLKGAYELFRQVRKINPNHMQAIIEMGEIKSTLDKRARKVYREAIINESLNLFDEAKEKLQEVQQIAPIDSEYYHKASERLKNYMD